MKIFRKIFRACVCNVWKQPHPSWKSSHNIFLFQEFFGRALLHLLSTINHKRPAVLSSSNNTGGVQVQQRMVRTLSQNPIARDQTVAQASVEGKCHLVLWMVPCNFSGAVLYATHRSYGSSDSCVVMTPSVRHATYSMAGALRYHRKYYRK